MLPNRKLKENKLQRPNNKMLMQYGGAEVTPVKETTLDETPINKTDIDETDVKSVYQEDAPDYKAPGILAGLSKYSASVILQAIEISKNAILKQLKIENKPGQSSIELYDEVNKILEDPETRLAFLNFAKNIADKGLSFIQVARPVANKSIEAVIEIFDEFGSKGGKSIVKIGKDVATEIPVVGSVMGFIFMCDDIVKFFQSGVAAIFQTGTKTNEVIVNTRSKMEGANDLMKASPDIAEAAEDVEKSSQQGKEAIIYDLQKRIKELEKKIGESSSSTKRAEQSISALGKTDEPQLKEEMTPQLKEKVVENNKVGGRNKKSSKNLYNSIKRIKTKKRYTNINKKLYK